jgi:hypothetical protein
MLIILRLAVLPHKHPHELLDSVVKERVVDPFVSTEARILQQPHLPSSDFENFFSISTTCAFDQHLASRQREANSTAFQTAVNRLFYRFRSSRPNHQQNQTTTLSARRILRSFRCFATPYLNLTSCFIRSLRSRLRLKSCAL